MDNPELGILAIKRIEADPDLLDMHHWAQVNPCGTTACLAGHVMLAAGYTIKGGAFWRPDGTIVPSEGQEARDLLGMTPDECVLPLFVNGERQGSASLWYEGRTGEEALALFREMVEKSMTE